MSCGSGKPTRDLHMDRESIERAIRELDDLLQADSPHEQNYQEWLERHPIAVLALGYRSARPHVQIRAEDGQIFIPDFLAQLPDEGWDIFELKTPQTAIIHSRERRDTFYATFATYVSQCHDYSEALDPESVRAELVASTGLRVQKRPQSIIVAGRSEGLDRMEVRKLCSRLTPPVRHYTFDDVLAQLEHFRTFTFGRYEEAKGFGLHFILRLYRPPNKYTNNYIFDVGSESGRNHISVFLNPKGYLRLSVTDANGVSHDARSREPFSDEDYGVPHFLYFDAGAGPDFGFMSISIDGKYSADIKTQDFPLEISNVYALGTNSNGTGQSWMATYQIIVLSGPAGFRQKGILRDHASQRIAEILANPEEKAVIFDGRQSLATQGHPSQT